MSSTENRYCKACGKLFKTSQGLQSHWSQATKCTGGRTAEKRRASPSEVPWQPDEDALDQMLGLLDDFVENGESLYTLLPPPAQRHEPEEGEAGPGPSTLGQMADEQRDDEEEIDERYVEIDEIAGEC